jgi:hypothetical protein
LTKSFLSPPPSTSAVLISLAGGDSERISVREIVSALRQQAFALLVVVLGLPNCLPMPPPIPLLCGFLLAFVALQIVLDRPSPWLPRKLLNRSVAKADVARAVERALPYVRWLERLSRPRFAFFDTPVGMRLIGVILLVIALGLLVAAPFIGQIPLGLAACLVGLGLVERDGLIVIGGVVLGLLGIGLSAGFVVAVVKGIAALIGG